MRRAGIAALLTLAAALTASACAEDANLREIAPPEGATVTALSEDAQAKLDQRLERAVVRVRNLTCTGLGTGSGFLVGDDRLITNHHVVDGAAELEVNLYDGRTIRATVDGVLRADDVGIVRLAAGSDLPDPLDVAATNPAAGTSVRALGFPLGGKYTVTEGSVTRERAGIVNGMPRLEFTAPVNHGNSGGPLVNLKGEVVGIVTEGVVEAGVFFAIPAADLADLEAQGSTAVQPCQETLAN